MHIGEGRAVMKGEASDSDRTEVVGKPPIVVEVKRSVQNARLPRYAYPGDAGLDLFSVASVNLPSGCRALIGTGVSVSIPDGFVGLVVPRSGLALERGITILNAPGVVDSGYRGELKVILVNLGTEAVELAMGSRIAQMLLIEAPKVSVIEVSALSAGVRGEKGFGSSGL